MGSAIRQAADEIVRGEMADQFPVDVFQTGSGTSTNMNMNEVIANRAAEILGDAVHPNDHVNASQSSNDTFPSAARMAAVMQITATLLPALESLRASLVDLSSRQSARSRWLGTHLMDAVPMTFGQEVSGWARAIELSCRAHRRDAIATRRTSARRYRGRHRPECAHAASARWLPSDSPRARAAPSSRRRTISRPNRAKTRWSKPVQR